MGRTTKATHSHEAFVAGIRRITLITSEIISLCTYVAEIRRITLITWNSKNVIMLAKWHVYAG